MSFTSKQFNELLLLLSWLCVLASYFSCHANGLDNNVHAIMCKEHEREALLEFKYVVREDCGLLSSWNDHDKNCCQWHGIHCSNHTSHVIKLNLRGISPDNPCLQGKVSPSLVDLKHLSYLDLSNNDFTGQPIPNFIGSLTKLKHLNLSHAKFQGEIPAQLGTLSHLTFLDLGSDFISQNEKLKVTSLSWLSNLTSLKSINLNGVDLSKATDWLKVINNLPFLRAVELGSCNLPSTFPWPLSYENSSTTLSFINLSFNSLNNSLIFQWLFNLTGISIHLVHLDLSGNQLEGPLPTQFGDLKALSFLDLSDNKFQGNLPTSFGGMQSLSHASFALNQFEGPIPHAISKIKLLTHLDLSSNNFSVLPKNLGNLCNLQELKLFGNALDDDLSMIVESLTGCASKTLLLLDLSGNQIWGSIPDKIGLFSSLTQLHLEGNLLNGTISQNLGQLSKLETLALSSNDFQGNLSHLHFLNHSRLKSLDLSNNPSLVVNIEADWIPPFQLDSIMLSSCIVGPMFPMWLVSQKNYTLLSINSASISDKIPESFSSTLPSRLHCLDMSYNKIQGPLPEFSNTLPLDNEPVIDLGFNDIEGSMPSFPQYLIKLFLNNNRFSDPNPLLCPQSKTVVYYLDLSNNMLSGELPDCWSNFDQLNVLRLDNNHLSGAIPPSIGHLKQLKVLHLRNNSFSGETPQSLDDLTSLVILDLGHNSFSGHITPTIGNNLTSLSFLSFQGNRFAGEIPSSLCQIPSLQILDLSDNLITGPIPNCIYNLTAMRNGTELFHGILYDVKNRGFFHIDVDATMITWKGEERNIAGSLGLVRAIDLSKNRLEGEIPTELSSLIGLVSLDLSDNNLSGSISPKMGELTALQFLNLSHNQLSGNIPASFTNLNFLGVLDLSYNHLSGQIPMGTLLQGFNASTYTGNPGLCGPPLPKCSWNQSHSYNGDNIDHHHVKASNDVIFPGMYISVILGFIIGFWGVCGSLVLKRSWRIAFFRFYEDVKTKVCVWYN